MSPATLIATEPVALTAALWVAAATMLPDPAARIDRARVQNGVNGAPYDDQWHLPVEVSGCQVSRST